MVVESVVMEMIKMVKDIKEIVHSLQSTYFSTVDISTYIVYTDLMPNYIVKQYRWYVHNVIQ